MSSATDPLSIEGETVLVTGGAGFIGSHVADRLLDSGAEVAILDDLSTGREANIPPDAKLFRASIEDEEAVREAFDMVQPDLVSHQAAQASVTVSVRNPVEDARCNVVGTLNILSASTDHDVKRVVFASTGGALYGEADPAGPGASEEATPDPKSPYGAAKVAGEAYVRAFARTQALPGTILRYGNVYGPRQRADGEAGVVAIFTRALVEGEPVTVYGQTTAGDGGCIRDYVYVGDVAEANLLALTGDLGALPGREAVYNVGTGSGRSTREVLEALTDELEADPNIVEEGPRSGDLQASLLDATRLRKQGWSPEVPFQEGIARTAKWGRGVWS